MLAFQVAGKELKPMAKLQENVENLFAPFRGAIGNDVAFDTICNQTAAMLGQLKIETTEGDWKVTPKGILTQGTKNKAALPMNNPASHLFACGLELAAVSKLRDVVINASIPKHSQDWVTQIVNKSKWPEKAKA